MAAVKWAAAAGGLLASFFRPALEGPALGVLLALVLLDLVAGTAQAVAQRKFSVGRFGGTVSKLLAYFLVLAALAALAHLSPLLFAAMGPVTWYFAAREGLSILAHAASLGIKAPAYVLQALGALEQEGARGPGRGGGTAG